jgi:serine/threonine protein kinase/Tol biopolymer transport system component
MGEVYRATDTKLQRDVALKILPDAFALDADRISRFKREAQVLASLNHPNIAAIYGFEDDDSVHALVLELIDGPTLADRIAQGPVPVDEALPIAKQIAEALEAAHEHGIIHRDLKPANIKVRADGTVKVLDFGLAKAMDPAGGSSRYISMSPTLSIHATQAGIVLGTAAYMAPEQARGKTVDKRADIWAFGAVLFEMLTGTPPFPGDDISQVMARVIERDPDWTALPSTLSPALGTSVRRCLVKDPRQRLRDIGDVRLALEGAFDTAPPQPTASLPSAARRRTPPWIAAFAVALLAATALSIPAARYLRETPPLETRVDIVTPATGQPASFALSPDGRQIAFVASDDKASRLWLRLLSTTTAQPLGGTDGAASPFWSPDGRSIGFFAGGALKRLDLGGGAPKTLAPATNGSGGTWNADGVIVFAPSITSPLMRVSATGGASAAVTTLGPQQFGHFNPHFLPDGRRLLFRAAGLAEVDGIYLGGLDGSSPTLLASNVTTAMYAPAGWLLSVRGGSLMAQRLDVERPALTGEPVTLADGVFVDNALARAAVSVAATGLIAYRTVGSSQRQLTWFDRSGTARGVVGEPDDSFLTPRVSPADGRVVVRREVQGNSDLWLLDGARARRFTFDPARDLFPVWSPDGTQIVYMRRTVPGDLYHKLTGGAGAEELLLSTSHIKAPTSWSADGRFLMYGTVDPQTNSDIWVLPMSGNASDGKPFVFLNTPFREANGAFSPDSRWVAYQSNETGRSEVYVRPFVPPGATGTAAATTGQWQVSTNGGIMPLWRADGKELYYINPDGAMMAAPITVTGNSVEPGSPVMLFPTRIYGGGVDLQVGRQYDVTADGRFLINTVLSEIAAPITLLQNWSPTAKR